MADIDALLDEALNGGHPEWMDDDPPVDEDEEPEGSLFHSITSYRQLKEQSYTPVKQIIRRPELASSSSSGSSSSSAGSDCGDVPQSDQDHASIQQQIRRLQTEV